MRNAIHEIDCLNDILEGAVDCLDGAKRARARTEHPAVSIFLTEGLSERRRMLRAVQKLVMRLGARAVSSGTVRGVARRALVNLRAHLGDPDVTLLDELERNDVVLLAQIESLLDDYRLSQRGRCTLNRFRDNLRAGLDKLHALRSEMLAVDDEADDESPAPGAPNPHGTQP